MARLRLPFLSGETRRLCGKLALAGACTLAQVVAPAAAQVVTPAAGPKDDATKDGAPRVDLDKLKRPAAPATPSNLFGSRSWEVKTAPKKVAPPPPPPPQAPPLPFTYVGRWIERGETTVMLSRGGRNYTAREGEKIDPAYLLERIESDRLVFRYVPLDQAQVLPFEAVPAALAQPQTNAQPVPQQKKRNAVPRDTDDEED